MYQPEGTVTLDVVNSGVPPQVTLQRLLNGARVTQVLYVSAKLGIADLLAADPMTADELAAAVGAHADALYRVLRAGASLGVLQELEPRRFALTPLGALLRSDHPDTVRPLAIFVGEEAYRAAGDLLYSAMTGATAFEHMYGMSHFAYLAEHPEASAIFNQTMSARTRQAASAVVAAYDFAGARAVVDVGGGQGALLTAILLAHPELRGALMDLPHVVAGAEPGLREAGVVDRCTLVGGDFFAAVPAGYDLYALRRVIHDWDDERGVVILRNCAQAMAPHGKVLVIEAVMESGAEAYPTVFLDVQMLLLSGGRERTAAEYGRLFAAAGLRLARIIPTRAGASILEGEHA